jgi:hypothetical protein
MTQRIIAPVLFACLICLSFTSIPSTKQSKVATSTRIDISGEYNPMCVESIMVNGKLHIAEQTMTNKSRNGPC